MRGPLHHAALALLAFLTSADVAHGFTPTADNRYIQAIPGFPTSMLTAAPFQPFDASLQIIVFGVQLGGASQQSSILVDGIVGGGGAAAGTTDAFPVPTSAASVLDVHFDLAESSVFSLSASVAAVPPLPGGGFFQLERTAPSPGTFVTLGGVGEFDQRVAMSPGSYRLQAAASGGGNTGGSFDFDFRLVCASASPQDSDADDFVDACDICPLDFDPSQQDSDHDGIGDVCDAPEVIEQILDPAVYAALGPTRAALAADGTAYVVSATNNRIFRIPPPVGPANELWRGSFYAANVSDVAIGPDGFVYTAGGNSAKCYRIDPITGAATLVIGPTGDGVGHPLTWANRVAVALDGRVFVSGRDSQNVFEIAVGGEITLVIGPSGNGSTALGQPRALEVDAAGNLYVLASNSNGSRLFRVTPAHQIQLVLDPFSFLNSGNDLALGPDGSIYIAGDGIFARRPSGALEVVLPLSDPLNAVALDVDASGVVHAVDQLGSEGFRITPAGQLGPLIDPDGDGQGHPLQSASDVVVSDGPEKRIVVVGTLSNNAFLITDVSSAVVPLFGPAAWVALSLALLGGASLARRR